MRGRALAGRIRHDVSAHPLRLAEPVDGEDGSKQCCIASISEPGLHNPVGGDFDADPTEIVVINEQIAVEAGVDECRHRGLRGKDPEIDEGHPLIVEMALDRRHQAMRRGIPIRNV